MFIFHEAQAAPTIRSILYFGSFLQCLMCFVLPQWYGSKRYVTMRVIAEGPDIHAAYTSLFHPDGEDRISLRKVGN